LRSEKNEYEEKKERSPKEFVAGQEIAKENDERNQAINGRRFMLNRIDTLSQQNHNSVKDIIIKTSACFHTT